MLDAVVNDTIEETVEQENSPFFNASDFVDAAIDAVDNISDLPVEAFVALAVLQITRNPREVKINVTKAQKLVIIELDVSAGDIAHVIGKQGHTINALRSLVASSAGRDDVEYMIYLLGDKRPAKHFGLTLPRRSPKSRSTDWPR